ncbi:MAG: S46 family peptidase [Rhodothermales bacterium]
MSNPHRRILPIRATLQRITPFLLGLALMAGSVPGTAQDTVRAGTFDNGKMWTFDAPPVEHIADTYGFTPDEAWFEKARLGALRLPNCSASFVSPLGLVMTNHHCGRGSVAQVSGPGESLLEDGFMAEDRAAERPVPGLYVDQLVALTDVTVEIQQAVERAETPAEKAVARQEAIAAVQERMEQDVPDGHHIQIISLYSGGMYSAYTFRRYTDIRLVMAPELNLGYFGGDTDNFTYPRYALDMTFFRVYENGQPYAPEHYFAWSADGAAEGDAVFVIGNPGSTLRLETVAQLEWRRDVQERALLDLLRMRINALSRVYEANPSDALLNRFFSLKNSEKLYTGRVKGLNDPVVMAKRRDTERTFLQDAPESTVVAELAAIQAEKRELAAEYEAFLSFTPQSSLASATMQRAALAWEYLTLKATGADTERLEAALKAIPDGDPDIDRRFFEQRLTAFWTLLGTDATATSEAVSQAVFEGSMLAPGAEMDLSDLTFDDPAVAAVAPYMERWRAFRSAASGLGAREAELNALHGRIRYDIYGTARPPDATFSLRLADGVVASYMYNGTHAPAFTTFHGLYDRYFSHALDANGTGEWDLPARWLDAGPDFDRSTPMNLVTTSDIVGGNSGSPLLNKDLEVVGLIFDGNIEFLPSAFIYQTEHGRSVAVDSRGMLEALRAVYDMDWLVNEIMSGVTTELQR